MNRQVKGTIFVLIICIQFILIGCSANTTDRINDDEPNNLIQGDGSSHSSPYYFPINRSSPLMTEENLERDSESNPKLAYSYYNTDYVLTLNLDRYVLTIGEIVTIYLGLTCNLTASSGKTIAIEIYQGFYRNYYYYYPSYYETKTPIYTINLTTNSNGQASTLFSQTSSEGIYTVYAYAEGNRVYKEFSVGEVGIFFKGPRYYKGNQDYTAALHIVNLSDFSSMPFTDFNYSISYYDSLDWVILTTDQGNTDAFGYTTFTANIPLEMNNHHILRLAIGTIDGKAEYQTFLYESWDYYYYCLWGGQQKTIQERFQYVVTTDKTIYSPGETINLRILVLEYSFMNETKQIMRNTPVSFTIYNPDEFAIFWSTLTTDENGILTFDFPLDEDCELGHYGFEFSQFEHSYRYNVRVDYYTKPVFRVEIDTNGKDFYPINEKLFDGYVEVSYYFGQVVVGATVELSILNYWGEVKYSKEGVTNSEGRYYFSINLQSIEDLDYSFKVQTEATDIYGRSASYEKIYTRIEELLAYGYLTDWAPHPDDTLEYYFYVYQYVLSYDYEYWNWYYNPLSNVLVNIDIYGIEDYQIYSWEINSRDLIATYSKLTNKFGAGILEFKIPIEQIKDYNFFEIRISVDLEDGRSTTSSYYFRYKKYSLDINIVDSALDLGQTLEFEVTFKDVLKDTPCIGEGRIYIYDTNHQLIGRVTDIISGSQIYHFYIPNSYPEGKYFIYSYVYSRSNQYYGGFCYHSAYKSFRVGSFQSLSFTSNFTNVGRYYEKIIVQIGDIIEISGFSNVSTNLPHYLEIYKRGLLFSEPITITDDTFTYFLKVKASFAPDFTIMVYTISDQGKLYEYILVVNIDFSYSLKLSTDKEIYEPGDLVTLTITPPENTTSMLALSFIDSAVLDVEPEDDSELAYFTMNKYSAYISSGSSWGTGFDIISYWWYGYGRPIGGFYSLAIEDPIFTPLDYTKYTFGVGPNRLNAPSYDELLTSFDTEIRKNITESANWKPKLIISEPTTISFKLPDNIGEWTIRAVINNIFEDSNDIVLWGAVETIQIKVFLPFFIEFEVSQPIFQDDILSINAYVYNYLGTDVHAFVAVDTPDLIILNKDVQEIFIPDGFVSEVEFSVYCIEPFFHNITLLAATEVSGNKYSDAKQLTVYIKPNGIEITNRTIGFLNATEGSWILNHTLEPLAIYHKETLALYTDLMDISIDSWQSLIGYPYGCIEQTISKVLPTALIFNYLNKTGQLTPSLEKEITMMILEGLNRIYNFQHSDGGWGWWRDDSSKVIMTSIVVSALNQIEEVGFRINPITLEKGIGYLISHQHPSGVWDFQEYSSNTLEATAFILKAIMNYKNKTSQIETAINLAVNEFSNLWYTGDMQSTYSSSLFYIATLGTIYENTTFNNILIQFIKDHKKVEENTIYWDSDTSSNWYWRKLGNIVEITSYAIWALALDDYLNNYALIQKSVQFLLNRRNRWGWGSTADTCAAITALTAIKEILITGGLIEFNGTIFVQINNNIHPQFTLNFTDSSNKPNEILLNLDNYLTENSNTINISLSGSGQICYIFETVQILRSNPIIEIPNIIEVKTNEYFNLSVRFTDIDNRMPLVDSNISLLRVPNELHDPEENYTKFAPILINGSVILYSLIAADYTGNFIIEGLSVLGFIRYFDAINNITRYQIFDRTVGPIIIKVGSQSYSSYPLNLPNNNSTISVDESLSLLKIVSKRNFLYPGEIITIKLKVSNDGDPRPFYVIDDEIPTGTIFLTDSVIIAGDYESSEITYDQSTLGIHFFFPMLASGITEITYQLQINRIKNSYSGQCKLWGMYDNICIISQSVILENIPRKYYANHSVYRDLKQPILSNVNITRNKDTPNIKLFISFKATDNNDIYRIRIIFAQNSEWRAQTLYSMQDQEDFSIVLTDFANIDSNIEVIVEVYDVYGNIKTSNNLSIKIRAYELIPYLIIGMIVGFSIGIASVASILYKKFENKKRNSHKGLVDKSKQAIRKISFIDDSEEDTESPNT
ncbi:MAG: MG2 domain-containing protein [Candidatus Hodarchaeota archaeon]